MLTPPDSISRGGKYWLCILPYDGSDIRGLSGIMPKLATNSQGVVFAQMDSNWEGEWQVISNNLSKLSHGAYKVAVIAAEKEPSLEEINFYAQPPEMIDKMAESYWLVDSLEQIICHYQPIAARDDSIFGYEAFARIEQGDKVISGKQIIEASRILNIKHIVDRQLLVKAVDGFSKSNKEGFLFLNFVPGFIQKPERYLSGLDDALNQTGLLAGQVIMDIDIKDVLSGNDQLKSFAQYCNDRRFKLAVHDVADVRSAEKAIHQLQPFVVKIDKSFTVGSLNQVIAAQASAICDVCRDKGVNSLAEKIESPETHQALKDIGVDLFQGFHIGKPA
jgi:EAL domain-containing protein (putative c-di-GMP-specific phosphodiesterase class I)